MLLKFWKKRKEKLKWVRATSHTSQEPWPWNCESLKASVQRAVPTHLQSHVVWSRILKCSAKSYVTAPSTKYFLFQWTSIHVSGPGSLRFVFGLPPRGGFWKWSKWPWNMVHSMPCTNSYRLYIHRAFAYFVGPSSAVWRSELGAAPPFPPMRVLEA